MSIMSFGCQDSTSITEFRGTQQPGITAQEILQTVLQQYKSAETYEDNAVLYLTYRLNGKAIQEPHPWSVAWNRNDQFAANLFNSKVRCDGNELSCYVFDIETGNVDNQHRLVAAAPFRHLFEDKIACHFIFGSSELPLDEIETTRDDQLVPPMLGFTDETLLPVWIRQPTKLQRLADDDSTGAKCYVLGLEQGDKTFRIWINQQNGLIEQIEFPLQYLDSQILASEEVANLRFFARFHDAKLDGQLSNEKFSIPERLAAKHVRHFVTLPEPIPCLKLGEYVGDIEFVDPANAQPLALESGEASVTSLLWLAGFNATELINRFRKLANDYKDKDCAFRIVYSDDLLNSPGSGSIAIAAKLRNDLSATGLKSLYDAQMKSTDAMQLKAVPSVIVLDKNHKVQFAKPIDSEDWPSDVKIAIDRIAKGGDVASEMKAEYQKFLEDYHRQLAAAAPSHHSTHPTSAADSNIGKTERLITKQLNNSNLVWELDSLNAPGNIHVPFGSDKIFVIDGWQTVVELDRNGSIRKRYQLELPENAAINRIRSLRLKSGKTMFVVFSMLGRKAFVFDQTWKQQFEFPPVGSTQTAGISECQLLETPEGDVELWVSLMDGNGVQSVDLKSAIATSVVTQPSRGFCHVSDQLFHLEEDGLFRDGTRVNELDHLKVTSIRGGPWRQRCLAIGKDQSEHWRLVCLNEKGTTEWSQPISSQFFENELDPLAIVNFGRHGSVAVAAKDGSFTVFGLKKGEAYRYGMTTATSGSLKLAGLAIIQSKPIFGSAESGNDPLFGIVAAESVIKFWRLSTHGTAAFPASVELNRIK